MLHKEVFMQYPVYEIFFNPGITKSVLSTFNDAFSSVHLYTHLPYVTKSTIKIK